MNDSGRAAAVKETMEPIMRMAARRAKGIRRTYDKIVARLDRARDRASRASLTTAPAVKFGENGPCHANKVRPGLICREKRSHRFCGIGKF